MVAFEFRLRFSVTCWIGIDSRRPSAIQRYSQLGFRNSVLIQLITYLFFQVNDDSSATEDTFAKLPKSVKSTFQGTKKESLDFNIHGLSELEMIVKIDIVLVGFDNDGYFGISPLLSNLLAELLALKSTLMISYNI